MAPHFSYIPDGRTHFADMPFMKAISCLLIRRITAWSFLGLICTSMAAPPQAEPLDALDEANSVVLQPEAALGCVGPVLVPFESPYAYLKGSVNLHSMQIDDARIFFSVYTTLDEHLETIRHWRDNSKADTAQRLESFKRRLDELASRASKAALDAQELKLQHRLLQAIEALANWPMVTEPIGPWHASVRTEFNQYAYGSQELIWFDQGTAYHASFERRLDEHLPAPFLSLRWLERYFVSGLPDFFEAAHAVVCAGSGHFRLPAHTQRASGQFQFGTQGTRQSIMVLGFEWQARDMPRPSIRNGSWLTSGTVMDHEKVAEDLYCRDLEDVPEPSPIDIGNRNNGLVVQMRGDQCALSRAAINIRSCQDANPWNLRFALWNTDAPETTEARQTDEIWRRMLDQLGWILPPKQ